MGKKQVKTQDTRERRKPSKNGFLLFYDTCERTIKRLDDKQLGEWFRLILEYEMFGECEQPKDEIVDIFLDDAIASLDRNMEKWEDTSGKRRLSGIRGQYGITDIKDGVPQFKTFDDRDRFLEKFGSLEWPPQRVSDNE